MSNHRRGVMATERPERYAKQLGSHWSRKADVEEEPGRTGIRFPDGSTVLLTPAEGELVVEVSVPDGSDLDGFAGVVAEHLQRFATRQELLVVWE